MNQMFTHSSISGRLSPHATQLNIKPEDPVTEYKYLHVQKNTSEMKTHTKNTAKYPTKSPRHKKLKEAHIGTHLNTYQFET